MQLLQSLSTKANVWHEKYGIAAKNLAKISVKTLIPGLGELLADGIDSIFEITDHKDHVKWNDQIDQHLATIQADQHQYLELLEMIESHIGSLLSEISREFQNQAPLQVQSQSQEMILKSLFDQSFSQHENQFIQLQQSLNSHTQKFQIVERKLDELYRKQIEIAIDLKEGNNSLQESIDALKQVCQNITLVIQNKQLEHSKHQIFRDFLVEIEHELLHHNPNRAKVILENAFIQKTIDLQFKQLYECKINALQGHLSQIEDLLEKSKELENLRGLINIKEQVKNASRWMTSHEKYRTFLHQSGKKIGDKGWQLDVPIGIGGMGEVWKAHNLKGDEGAIKFVHEELLMNQFAKKKFFDEIESLTRLKHPNIVSLKDWGIESGSNQLYLVMDYIEGETMRQLINRKHYLTWDDAKVIFLDLVEALYFCHQANIIHKDIKPDNIILRKNPKNQPILIDFGIAKIKPISTSTVRKTKHILGTERYMSPEQKNDGHIDEKSDIYSLGVTLLEVLTGKCAVDGKLINLQDEILNLIEDCLATWRRRYDSLQLFEKLGGDLNNLNTKLYARDHVQREYEKQIKALDLKIQEQEIQIHQQTIQIQDLLKQIQSYQTTDHQVQGYSSLVIDKNRNTVSKLNGIQFNMIYCPAGTFWMGIDASSTGWWKKSRPRHKVNMKNEFWIGETQVTQALWQSIMGWNPSGFKGSENLPVEMVNWYDCLVFCNKLSELENRRPCFNLTKIEKVGNHIRSANLEWDKNANGYRLPTEAEWEYAAKAGTELIYSGSNHLDEIAWYHANSGKHRLSENLWAELNYNWDKYVDKLTANQNKTHEVKTKKPNQWGLYDMTGNIWEWCMDQWDQNIYQYRSNEIENPILWNNEQSYRVLRGGSSGSFNDFCRVAYRSSFDSNTRSHIRGFRLLRSEA